MYAQFLAYQARHEADILEAWQPPEFEDESWWAHDAHCELFDRFLCEQIFEHGYGDDLQFNPYDVEACSKTFRGP